MVALALAGSTFSTNAQTFVPHVESLDLQGHLMPDVEWDTVENRATWQDDQQQLWVINVDYQGGDFLFDTAKILATNLVPAVGFDSGTATGNGPEWGNSNTGSNILYSIQDGPTSAKTNWRVGEASHNGENWKTGFANGANHLLGGAPEPTKVTNDSNPLTAYYYQAPGQTYLQLYWHSLVNSQQGGAMPFVNSGPGRWEAEAHRLVSTMLVADTEQVVLFDAASPSTYTQVTFDKAYNRSKPAIFRAPEYGNAEVVMVLESVPPNAVTATTQIGLYRVINNVWTRFDTIIPPAEVNFELVNSPEAAVYDGASYIFFAQVGTQPSKYGSKIWVSTVGKKKTLRQLAAPSDGVISTDPEYVKTEGGLFLFLGQRGGQQIYRAWTGIGPRSKNIPYQMAYVPKSTFGMGDNLGDGDPDELPVHNATTSAFFIDRYQVTGILWQTVVTWANTHGYAFPAHVAKGSNYPITVNWYEAAQWCNARSEMEGRAPAYFIDAKQKTVYRTGNVNLKESFVNWTSGYRLPTETEWENAGRGGQIGVRFPNAGENTISHEQSNYLATTYFPYDVSDTLGYHPLFANGVVPYTAPVTSFATNGFGLHAIAGNVWQWVWDWYGATSYSIATPLDYHGPKSGMRRVIRGGSWASNAFECRISRRGDSNFQPQADVIGFRTVLPEQP